MNRSIMQVHFNNQYSLPLLSHFTYFLFIVFSESHTPDVDSHDCGLIHMDKAPEGGASHVITHHVPRQLAVLFRGCHPLSGYKPLYISLIHVDKAPEGGASHVIIHHVPRQLAVLFRGCHPMSGYKPLYILAYSSVV